MGRKIIFLIVGIVIIIFTTKYFINLYDRPISTTITENYPSDGLQLIETKYISIVTPLNWSHKSGFGDDIVWGEINTTLGHTITYDLTIAGGANPLVLSEDESIFGYINYNWIIRCDTNENFYIGRYATIIEKRINNPKGYYEFIARIEICDSVYEIDYNLDNEYFLHNFDSIIIEEDTFKLIYPKTPDKGVTGIYGGGKNFWSKNLDKKEQKEFIEALKTLKIKSLKIKVPNNGSKAMLGRVGK